MKVKLIVVTLLWMLGQSDAGVLALQDTAQNPPPTQNTKPNANRQARANQRAQRAQGAPVQAPPEFNDGITALQSAKNSLQQAGSAWGGHRVAAVHLINKALDACGQKQTNTGGTTSGAKAPDDPTALQDGVTQLTTAKGDFQNIQNAWGGRRDKAISFIDQALTELQSATAFVQRGPAKKPKAAQ